ncbi:MAG TPA: ABC transporter ATP-binding protein [Candidatus Onthovicinus excrementipullorum]|nr:ABC transporter ATP-binding protein [Candidatus Onthovicinus excrementipullorum]
MSKRRLRRGGKKGIIRRLMHFTGPYKKFLIPALLACVIGVSLSLLAPVMVGHAVDYLIGPGEVQFGPVARYLIALVAVIVLSALFQYLMGILTNAVTYRTVRDMRKAVFARLNILPLKTLDAGERGDTINRVVTDMDLISDGIMHFFTQLFNGIVTVVMTLIFMFSLNIPLALVVVCLTPLSLLVSYLIAKKTGGKFREQADLRGEIGAFAEERITNQRLTRAFCSERNAQNTFEEINQRLYNCGWKAQFYSSITNPGTRFINAIVTAAVAACGGLLAVHAGGGMWAITVGELSSFILFANQYAKPFNEITGVVTELQNAYASAVRIFDTLDEQPESDDSALPALQMKQGNVRLEHVCFSYDKERPLIRDINLDVQKGERVAIVGKTGCGKTTLINLLMRFYDLDSGRILIDGQDVSHMTRDSLRAVFGMVLQDTWIFTGTVRENIAYGKPDATEEEIVAAAKAAHAHSFIKRLENGYDTMLYGDASRLSQGQRQMISIARVMLVSPPILILDEATSNIDTLTERRVQRAFDKMMQGRTSFVVAHRLSTIKEADVILMMDAGQVLEQGTHEELLAKDGAYARLYRSQFEGGGK